MTFQYNPSDQNPANHITRGLTVPDLKNFNLWWNGPMWLTELEEHWPVTNNTIITQEMLKKVNGRQRDQRR